VSELATLLTAEQVGQVLGKHYRTVLILAERGELASIRLGHRTVRFQASDVQEYIDRHRTDVLDGAAR
jgi:excisionase family DNA binding protein